MANGYVKYDPSIEKDARKAHVMSSMQKGGKIGAALGTIVPGVGNLLGYGLGTGIGWLASKVYGGDKAAADAKKIGIEQMNMENQLVSQVSQAENVSGLGGSPWEVGTRSSRMSPIPGNINPENTPASQYEQMLKFQNISGVNTLG
jgi:hypothetical protein